LKVIQVNDIRVDDARGSGVAANEERPLHPPTIELAIPRGMSMTTPSLVDDPAGSEAGNEPENDPSGQ
jgi:hypothetical protein